jgi:hypothetical protein
MTGVVLRSSKMPGSGTECLRNRAAVTFGRIHQKMAHTVELSALASRADVDRTLHHAAVHGRFATGDLDYILAAKGLHPTRRGAGENTPSPNAPAAGTCSASTSSTHRRSPGKASSEHHYRHGVTS